jgi:RNA recognition motif-containing protein
MIASTLRVLTRSARAPLTRTIPRNFFNTPLYANRGVRFYTTDDSVEQEPQFKPRKQQGGQQSKNSLFVRNISYRTTEDALRQYFSQAGDIVKVTIPVDRETKRPRGFGFVQFRNQDEAQKALELDGSELDGRQLFVSLSERNQN